MIKIPGTPECLPAIEETLAEGINVNVTLLFNEENYVKVAVDLKNNSLFFSRSPIPYARNKEIPITYYEHIGVYAFRKQALLDFTSWPLSPLEAAEKIECLRYLEHGVSIKMVTTDYMGVEIDTPADLERAARLL